jgi:hypothetical protein
MAQLCGGATTTNRCLKYSLNGAHLEVFKGFFSSKATLLPFFSLFSFPL